MENIFNILKQIGDTSSRLEKEKILKDNEHNQTLKKVLEYTYNPYKVYNLSKKSLKGVGNTVLLPPTAKFDNIFELLDYLQRNNRSYEVINNALYFLHYVGENEQDLYIRMILKDLRMGCNTSTINKVYGKGYIPVFDVMLAKSFRDHRKKVEGQKIIVTTKLDGFRCVGYREDNKVKFFTRQGKAIEGMVELEKEFMNLPNKMVFDGELLAINVDKLQSKDLYNLTKKLASKDGEKVGLEFHVFDMLPLEEFKVGKSTLKCETRKNLLHQILCEFEHSLKRIIEVPIIYQGESIRQIPVLLKSATDNGEEGIMVNLANAAYECKRTDNLLKVKVFNSFDLKITDVMEGEGKYKGQLGALVVDYKGFSVGVGSGFSDVDRVNLYDKSLIGRVIEVQFFEETQNEKGELSLRFPVFKGLREVGKEVSYN